MLLGVVGKVDFTVRHLSSGTTSFPSAWGSSSSQQCIGSGAHQVKTRLYVCLLLLCVLLFLALDFAGNEQLLTNILEIILRLFSYLPAFCIYCKCFIRDNVVHAHDLPWICCYSRYYCWICSLHCMWILPFFKWMYRIQSSNGKIQLTFVVRTY